MQIEDYRLQMNAPKPAGESLRIESMIMETKMFSNLFAQFDSTDAAPKYQALRQSARARLQALPLPTTRTEDWRFTSIAPIADTAFHLATTSQPIDASKLPAPASASALRLVFVNGRFVKSLSTTNSVAGVSIGSLAEGKSETGALAQIAGDHDQVFTAINTSFLNDGAFVLVAEGAAD